MVSSIKVFGPDNSSSTYPTVGRLLGAVVEDYTTGRAHGFPFAACLWACHEYALTVS